MNQELSRKLDLLAQDIQSECRGICSLILATEPFATEMQPEPGEHVWQYLRFIEMAATRAKALALEIESRTSQMGDAS
jgi:hypothetical protein